ncbi:hypothetical protein [uncultured Paraglaciecola sp.]|uniref:hypothetical protein n=1 Tax=uncultured Paraglaciecola sp. TaxID=1765024 RepID=UPI0026203D85|nr:hypothetical protein [uncultured Paraglaciecola sp.]
MLRATDGTETIISTGFTIPDADIKSSDGGTITYPVSPNNPILSGVTVFPYRDTGKTQPNAIGRDGKFFATVHEDTFDRLEMQIQEVDEEAGRSLKVQKGTSLAGDIPAPEAGKALVGNSNADGYINASVGEGDIALDVAAVEANRVQVDTQAAQVAADKLAAETAAAQAGGVKTDDVDAAPDSLDDKIAVTGNLTKAVVLDGSVRKLSMGVSDAAINALINAHNTSSVAGYNTIQVDTPVRYGTSTDLHLTHLDITITVAEADSTVELDALLQVDMYYNAMFYVKRKLGAGASVEVGTPAAAGNRVSGLSSTVYDQSQNSIMAPQPIKLKDTPGAAGSYTYEIHCRFNSTTELALNRTYNDVDTNEHERGVSVVTVREILSAGQKNPQDGLSAYELYVAGGGLLTLSEWLAQSYGSDAWTPVWEAHEDGASRIVFKVDDWTGGTGTKPQTGYYGPNGTIVALPADALNFRGTEFLANVVANGLAAGASPTVALSGTSANRTLTFGIPAGATGATGAQGPQGDTGATGATGADGADGSDATVNAVNVATAGAFMASGVSAFGATLTDDADAEAARATLNIYGVSVGDYNPTLDESTDNTAKVQAALDAADGGEVFVPDKCYFDLSALTFPNNSGSNGYYSLNYRANDDTSSPGQPGANATNERVLFIQNNNSSGYANENQLSSGYSTGQILDVRRDVNAPNVGAGQDVEFGRVSYVWRQDGINRVQLKYTDAAGDTSSPGADDGWTAQIHEARYTLTGIDQSSFSATLAVNDMIKGSTSGARGWVKQINVGSVIISWLSGTFVVGETVILEPAAETTTDTITDAGTLAYTSRSNRLGFSAKESGNLFSNIQGDKAVYPFTMGGILGIQQANTINGAFTNAEIIMVDDFGNPTQQARMQLEASTGDIVFLNETSNLEVLRLSNIGAGAAEADYIRAATELQAVGGTIRFGTSGGSVTDKTGSGSPEGVLTAAVGSTYRRTNGAEGTTFYTKKSGVGNTGWVAQTNWDINPMDHGALQDGSTDNSTEVDLALAALPSGGGVVRVPKDVRFNILSLTFPERSILKYFGEDDLSDTSIVASNEERIFYANANVDGIVNEQRIEAAYHPAQVINVRKNITGHDSELGVGQSKDNPARASHNIFDEDTDVFRTLYETYANQVAGSSPFSGASIHIWVKRWAIAGVGTDHFTTNPVVDDILVGDTSGAVGQVVSIAATSMVLVWLSGSFQAGETLSRVGPAETSSTTITTATYSRTQGLPIYFGQKTGRIAFCGLRPGENYTDVAVGGSLSVTPTRTGGFHNEEVTVDPIFSWLDANSLTPNGVAITYDVTPAAVNRRLEAQRVAAGVKATPMGHIGAAVLHCAFTNALALSASNYNAASVARNATGDYTITFDNAVATADYAVALTEDYLDADKKAVVYIKTATVLRIRVYDTADFTSLVDLDGSLNVVCLGGDI